MSLAAAALVDPGRRVLVLDSGSDQFDAVVPDSVVGEVVSLEDVLARLEGRRGADTGPEPKVHVDPHG